MLNLFDFNEVLRDAKGIFEFIPITLKLAVFSGIIGLLLGLLIAIIKIKRIPILNQLASVYISFLRGTPILVQLYISYYGIPIAIQYINFYYNKNIMMADIKPIYFAIFALALNSSAFNSVVLQSSFEGVNKGEIEAAAALGMTGIQRMIRIIIPEALELALPNLGNQFIGLVKGTSLAFSCAIVEMTAQGKILGAGSYRFFEAYVALAFLYWCITIVIEIIMKIVMSLIRVPEVVDNSKKRRLRFND